jgi:dTDP-4-amino-4,6-dideoxygalactose transaminase
LVENRNAVLFHLLEKGIEVKTWTAVHKQPIWDQPGLPVASNISDKILLLPIHNTISELEVLYVIQTLKEILK